MTPSAIGTMAKVLLCSLLLPSFPGQFVAAKKVGPPLLQIIHTVHMFSELLPSKLNKDTIAFNIKYYSLQYSLTTVIVH